MYQPPVRAPYAASLHDQQRAFAESESVMRSPFQRDRDRIIHCGAFRKLKQKTQVFVYHVGDYYRTRLTHTLEVAQITRSLARALGVDEDLAEAVALAHDLGHTPFGHAGEEALAVMMQPFGGFAHNDQTLRIITQLEERYAAFDGLNLTLTTLDGIIKHNGPIAAGEALQNTVQTARILGIDLATHAGIEAQIAAISDDIAYTNHDFDDGLRAGLIDWTAIAGLPMLGDILKELLSAYPKLETDPGRLRNELIRRLINVMVMDVLAETQARLKQYNPVDQAAVQALPVPTVAFSTEMQQTVKTLKKFLFDCLYRHHQVNRMTRKARQVVSDLFMVLLDEPELLPNNWRQKYEQALHEDARARIIADYIAGMTDNYALEEYGKIFDPLTRP